VFDRSGYLFADRIGISSTSRHCAMFTGKAVSMSALFFAAPSAQRTIEESEADQSAVDGDLSSDDPGKLNTKR
jgi:hypothetical protein